MTWTILIVHAMWLGVGVMLFMGSGGCHGDVCDGSGAGTWGLMAFWALVEMFLLPAAIVLALLAIARRLAR